MKKILFILLTLFLITSCNSGFHIEKRKYLSGYFVDISSRKSISPHQNKYAVQSIAESPLPNDPEENAPQKTSYLISSAEHECTFSGNDAKKEKAADNFLVPSSNKKSEPDAHANKTSENTKKIKHEGQSVLYSGFEKDSKAGEKKSDNFFLILAGSFCLITAFSLRALFTRPTNLAWWASKNRIKTVAAIAVMRFFIGATGMFVGKKLYELGIITSEISTYILFALAGLSALLYRIKKSRANAFPDALKKINLFGLLLTLAGFLLMVNISNRACSDKTLSPVVNSAISGFDKLENTNSADRSQEVQLSYTKEEGKYAYMNPTCKVLLTILAIILFLALMLMVAALSCGLICNGQEALAALVLLAGVPGGIILLINVMKSIWGDKTKKVVQPT